MLGLWMGFLAAMHSAKYFYCSHVSSHVLTFCEDAKQEITGLKSMTSNRRGKCICVVAAKGLTAPPNIWLTLGKWGPILQAQLPLMPFGQAAAQRAATGFSLTKLPVALDFVLSGFFHS